MARHSSQNGSAISVPSIVDLDKALCKKSLYGFMQVAWKQVDNEPFRGNWHIEAMCEHLEAVTSGQIRNLIINVPPGFTKSMTVSVMWPAWEWGPRGKPETSWLCASYSERLTLRDSTRCRELIDSAWYRERWRSVFSLKAQQNEKSFYQNTKHGFRLATTIGGMGTGARASRILVDDPHNIEDAGKGDSGRESVISWYDGRMSTRDVNPATSARVIIMQRSHENDLVGHIARRYPHDYEWLVLPMEFESARRCRTSIGFVDPRIEDGALAWPDRFPAHVVQDLKTNKLGSYQAAAQLQQRPSPASGGMFKREWWKRYHERPADKARECVTLFQSWDMAFKDNKDSSYVVGQLWGVKGADRFLIDQVRARMDFVATKRAVRDFSAKWPTATLKLVEDKANGPAIISELKHEVSGLIAVPVEGSKQARAFAVTPEIEAGNVHVPLLEYAPWVDEFLEEHAAFDKGVNDDQVDACSQALARAKKIVQSAGYLPFGEVERPAPWAIG